MVGSMLLITIIGSILFEMDLLQQIMIRSGTALFCFLLYRNYFNITNTIWYEDIMVNNLIVSVVPIQQTWILLQLFIQPVNSALISQWKLSFFNTIMVTLIFLVQSYSRLLTLSKQRNVFYNYSVKFINKMLSSLHLSMSFHTIKIKIAF